MKGTLHEDQYRLCITSRSFLHRMRNVSEKSCRENQNTPCVQYFFIENPIFYEIMWKYIAELGRPQVKIQCTHIAC